MSDPTDEQLKAAFKAYVNPTGKGYNKQQAKRAYDYLTNSGKDTFMAENKEANRKYEMLEKQRQKNVAKNLQEGRSMESVVAKGTPMPGSSIKQNTKTLSEAVDKTKEIGGHIKNIDNVKRVADESIGSMGINPEVRNRELMQKIAREAGEEALKEGAEKVAKGGISDTLKAIAKTLSKKKFSNVIPVVGTAAAVGSGLYSAGSQASEGDYSGAAKTLGKEALDMLTPTGLEIGNLGEGSELSMDDINARMTPEQKERYRMYKKLVPLMGE